MSPILGIIDSAKSGHLWAPSGAYDSLQSVTLSAATAQITFANIPQTYTHLQLRGIIRSDRAGNSTDQFRMIFNGDSGNNYATHLLGQANGNPPTATASTSAPYIYNNAVTGATATANVFGVIVMDILDYSSTNKYKTVRFLGGQDSNTSGIFEFASGLWMSSNAVNSLKFNAIGNLVAYTQFSLYGVK